VLCAIAVSLSIFFYAARGNQKTIRQQMSRKPPEFQAPRPHAEGNGESFEIDAEIMKGMQDSSFCEQKEAKKLCQFVE